MREIKFRVWDRPFKKWIRLDYYKDLGAITVETDGTLTLGSAFRFIDSMMIIPEEFEVMQYTGLKDKNGVEIYEGDIFKIIDSYEEKEHIVWVEYSEEYAQYVFRCNEMYYDKEPLADIDSKTIIIIGNIYDNPELLKGRQE